MLRRLENSAATAAGGYQHLLAEFRKEWKLDKTEVENGKTTVRVVLTASDIPTLGEALKDGMLASDAQGLLANYPKALALAKQGVLLTWADAQPVGNQGQPYSLRCD